jgi:hypothetical protein
MYKIAYIKQLISIVLLCFIIQSCGKDAHCKEFSSDERAWVPFADGQTSTYKNEKMDSTIILTIKKRALEKLEGNKYEGLNYCAYEEAWWYTNEDTAKLVIFLPIKIHNSVNGDKKKDNYTFYMLIRNRKYFPSNSISVFLNSKSFSNVLVINDSDNAIDTFYYAKNIGCIAFHYKNKKEWYYLQ